MPPPASARDRATAHAEDACYVPVVAEHDCACASAPYRATRALQARAMPPFDNSAVMRAAGLRRKRPRWASSISGAVAGAQDGALDRQVVSFCASWPSGPPMRCATVAELRACAPARLGLADLQALGLAYRASA